ncbi:MAG: (2Fe-2S)-binding protein, partial [Verrucomicrobia bacterium]|nr:(2Fe-2S)-binding protein [Verrucomicrobiota bacterium]
MPITLTIDGREAEAAPGETILAVAQRLSLDIPTLCYLEKCGPMTSCLACVVKINGHNGQSRVVPSCATKVQPGMIVESESAEVREMRRTALELLLGDHAGDCLSPCHRICPLHLNIPVMIRQIESGQLREAIATIKDALAMPAVLGRLCHHPCENGCRRGTWDSPAAIRDLERFAADADLQSARIPSPLRERDRVRVKALDNSDASELDSGSPSPKTGDGNEATPHPAPLLDRGGEGETQVGSQVQFAKSNFGESSPQPSPAG